MNIKVNGNIITIASKINFSDLENLGPTYVYNETGKKVYGVSISEIPSISPVGASFTFMDADDNACMNLVTDCMQPTLLASMFVKDEQEALEALLKYEDAIIEALNAKKTSLDTLETLIEIG